MLPGLCKEQGKAKTSGGYPATSRVLNVVLSGNVEIIDHKMFVVCGKIQLSYDSVSSHVEPAEFKARIISPRARLALTSSPSAERTRFAVLQSDKGELTQAKLEPNFVTLKDFKSKNLSEADEPI